MSTPDPIDTLVDRFVADIRALLERARGDRRTEALAVVQSMLRALPSRPERLAARRLVKPARARPHREVPRAARRKAARAGFEAVAAKPTLRPEIAPSLDKLVVDKLLVEEPRREEREGPDRTAREALVLDAVRALVRATAIDVAQKTGLPNGTVYVALRALVAAGRLAKTDTTRGIEYALVSQGSIRPFKRARLSTPTPAMSPVAEDLSAAASRT